MITTVKKFYKWTIEIFEHTACSGVLKHLRKFLKHFYLKKKPLYSKKTGTTKQA